MSGVSSTERALQNWPPKKNTPKEWPKEWMLHLCRRCVSLQHTAAHCSTLQHTAALCSTPQHSAAQCSKLQHRKAHGNTRQHNATHCEITHTIVCRGQVYNSISSTERKLQRWPPQKNTPQKWMRNATHMDAVCHI